jgi:hypothetical protein
MQEVPKYPAVAERPWNPQSWPDAVPHHTAVEFGHESPTRINNAVPQQQHRSHKWTWIAVVVIILVIGAVIGGCFGYLHNVKNSGGSQTGYLYLHHVYSSQSITSYFVGQLEQ